ncbi:hypothetical protein AO1008_10120 [Aspergillus oryzae 100-8]|uniref:Integral membrane protein n=1 Tax=Aspergillus oryzae (strain 3.042) TaxID=1160506 RepID=I8A919_ASPO3|nr:hypothetical protein Ao3042_02131 [Aspergillus oryzae 3.042]KDE83644.1 hypothetical protein AO1008_10120 [Aspergillus oryzae 100-8]|eukprot:EIT81389.1 hypothetical protein Ao3042_02131 [Aspergillus oryzae 3.042]
MQDIVTKVSCCLHLTWVHLSPAYPSQSQLAGALLLILSLLCSKLSMTVFICNLTPASRDHILARVAQGLISVTAVTALFGTAFQCRYPRTWDYLNEQCIDRVRLQRHPMVLILHHLVIDTLSVVASSIAEIILSKAHTSSTDPFIHASPTTICMEITQSLSIITACWGQLKPFMVRLRSNAFCLQNNEWTNTAYNGRPRPSHVSCARRRVLSESGGDFVLSSTYGRKTKTSTSRASAEWESQSQSSETYIVQEARTWTVDLPTADVAPITASRSGGMGK